MVFIYDANGVPLGLKYRNSTYAQSVWDSYWYERNLQGDIVAIYNDANLKLASYTYDAWGNHVVTPYNDGENIIAVANNPIRYRGYYYDTDLGLYYLQTRYYDSNIGRFINADGYISTGTGLLGYNMYAYCNNNPVIYVDYNGKDAILITAFGYNEGGIPIVGHSAILVQKEGDWYLIQYAGSNKPSAKVKIYWLNENQENDLYGYIESQFGSKYWATELSGDYSASYDYAMDMMTNNADLGGYNLFTNNCSHFVADVMEAGHSNNSATEAVHNNTRPTVPLITHLLTSAANFIGDKYRELKERMGW